MKYNIDYSGIPEHMRDGVRLYLEEKIPPGDFLIAILENNLVESFAHADHINITRIYDWAKFLYSQMPVGAWGSKEIVKKWINGN